MTAAIILLRVIVGASFAAHGAQKLFGWFGGAGLTGTEGELSSLGYRWPLAMAALAGFGELTCGLLFLAGLAVPVAALILCVVMVNAIAAVHWTHGFWNYKGGYELNLVYIGIAFAIALIGAGPHSIDDAIGWSNDLTAPWIIAAVGLVGIVAGVGLNRLATSQQRDRFDASAQRP